MNSEKGFAMILILFTFFHICYAKRYDDYSMYAIYPESNIHRIFLENLNAKKFLDLIFLDMPSENPTYHILVNKGIEDDFMNQIHNQKVKAKKLSSNAQELFDAPIYKESMAARSESRFDSYRSLEDIYAWMNDTAAKFEFTSVESIGQSAEGREILSFAIKEPPKPNYHNLKVLIEGSIHGNEWIAAAATTFLIDQILTADKGPYRDLRKRYFLYFIPIVNPDGYVYSMKEDRLWKKNRRKLDEFHYGVNLNRNFNYNFGMHDASDDPASQLYSGPYPFSEPESIALRDFIQRKHSELTFYISLHGHGQKFILPYSDSMKHIVNYHEVQGFAKKAINRMGNIYNKIYKVGLASEILGKKYSGDSASWVKNTYHIPYTLTVQLRDSGEFGLALPASQILPASEEISEGLAAMMLSSGRYQVMEDYTNNFATKVQIHFSLLFISLPVILC